MVCNPDRRPSTAVKLLQRRYRPCGADATAHGDPEPCKNNKGGEMINDNSRFSLGLMSYLGAGVRVFSWGGENERLTIGNYVSVADDVTFLLGGNHSYKGFSTFPFKVRYFGYPEESLSKGPIVIDDDVWIGYGSIILSGIVIGRGACIAAGSVVTKDVKPYTVVAGNPAKMVKLRFGDNTYEGFRQHNAIVNELRRIDYSRLTRQAALTVGEDILYMPLTVDNVKHIVDLICEACR